MVRLIIIILLTVAQAIWGAPSFLLEQEDYWLRALTYSFFHGNWWHLAINCLAIWTIFTPKRKFNLSQLFTAYLIAVLVYPLSFRPVIGFSNILYATLGLRTPSLTSKWWKQTNVIVFIIVTVVLVLVPRFSTTTHIASFLLGMAGASLRRCWLKLSEDARRYY